MNTIIIVADACVVDREDVDGFEGSKFEDVHQFLETSRIDCVCYTLSEFMEACNNDEIDLHNSFISYIHVEDCSV